MAASQRRHKATLPTEPAWPAQKNARGRSQDSTRKAADRRRRFAMLVVVPVLLMLGSVYLNTLAAGLDARTAELEVRLDRAREAWYARAEEQYLESLWSKSGGWEERWGTTGRGKTAATLTGRSLATQRFAVARTPPHAAETRDASPLVAKSYRSAARGEPSTQIAPPRRVARPRSAPKPGVRWDTRGCGWWRRCSR